MNLELSGSVPGALGPTHGNPQGDSVAVAGACIGIELQTLGRTPSGELLRVQFYTDHPDALCLQTFAGQLGCSQPVGIGGGQFVAVYEQRP